MRGHIKNTEDVKKFAVQLIGEGVSFHPDDDFADYVNFKTGEPCYSGRKSALRNRRMAECFEVCSKENTDIYEIMLAVSLTETGMDKFISPPR